MVELNWGDDARFLARAAFPAAQLQQYILANMGARIGESTVVSQKLHTFNPATPQEIQILQDTDAGQVFYNRRDRGKIFHLDIFHQCGLVDHRQVAAAIKSAINTYNFHYTVQKSMFFTTVSTDVKQDLIDVQTGTGGGRITGDLNYGKKLSLRKAHENHVHVALMLPIEHIACLFYIVAAVEETILNCHLELRRNERIIHKTGGGAEGSVDLSPYSDQSDSFLREKQPSLMSETVREHQYLQDAIDLAEIFDTVQQVRDFLSHVEQQPSAKKLMDYLNRAGVSEQAAERLEGLGLIQIKGKELQLTQYGQDFKQYLDSHMPELEAHLRRTIRLIKPIAHTKGRSPVETKNVLRRGQRQAVLWSQGDTLGNLAVAETVLAAARRQLLANGLIHIDSTDIHHMVKHEKTKAEICLVLDASASMAGQRIRAAKFLARHLLLSTPDRIGVVVFQENNAKVQVPLTRDFNQVENSLSAISSFGSTPLALGLKTCLEYLKDARARNPFIILITDGVPTVSDTSNDPLADALAIAGDIKKCGYGFTCIGLKPHKDFLNQLTEAAGGSAYIFDELEKQVLVKAAWAECSQRKF